MISSLLNNPLIAMISHKAYTAIYLKYFTSLFSNSQCYIDIYTVNTYLQEISELTHGVTFPLVCTDKR